ncbi:MAG TPA: hypothetical protein VLA06_09135 [Woeseiaceae bacterium]|jgi:hypothetical protein|nr:hypothetical protein [Woeseiaceae bacterium]
MSGMRTLALVAMLLPATIQAADTYVPEELQGWQQWVLDGREHLECPFLFNAASRGRNDFICAWPGSLELSVDADGGRFTQPWTVYGKQQWIPLPGSAEHWPSQVTVNGRSAAVVARGEQPGTYLPRGSYRLSGRFAWDERPGVLAIPDASGLVTLVVDGSTVARPERNDGGIFLGEREREQQARDAVETQVYRLVADNVPTRLITQLRIDVAGGVREELFGPILPAGFVPLAMDSPLPARLEPDGRLRVQVRPGRWTISLRARGPEVLDAVTLPVPEANLPGTEIWSYRSNDRLRVTAAAGVPPVDPVQAQVPGDWRSLPAFRVEPGQALAIEERSRGIVAADNELSLDRQMWLDFDGGGFVVNDAVGGEMRNAWRLDMAEPFTLLSAAEFGENLLVTEGDDGETGVEIRRRDVALQALGQAATRATMPVTGWDARFASVATVLHLPPGSKLLAAPGVDRAPGSWVSRWQLLDFFLVLIITIAAWRLFGSTAGVVALLALVLSFHELNAPGWLWLNLLVAVALLRVAPEGRLRQGVRTYQALSALALLLVLVPFLAGQLRIAIYPQLEPQFGAAAPGLQRPGVSLMAPRPAAEVAADAYEMEKAGRLDIAPAARLEEIQVSSVAARRYARYAPNAIVQAGAGIPSWEWNSYRLSWSGPVDAEQTLRLIIMPRWLVSILRFVEIAALLLFAAVFAAEIFHRRFELPGGLRLGRAPASALLAAGLLGASLAVSPVAEAQTPDPALLQELEERLTRAPECVPRCAELVAAEVDVSRDNLRMTLVVHALEEVAIPLPGSAQGWRPTAIAIDGAEAGQVMRGQDRWLWARLAAGQHRISLSGAIPVVDSLEVPFPAPPRVVEASGEGWYIAGIKDRRLLSGSLQLTRLQAEGDEDSTPRWESSRFPAFARVERAVNLDLDWSVTTTVMRVAPVQGALTLEVPVLDGETVLTEAVTVEDGKALVSMNPNQQSVAWRSSLPRVSPLVLSADAGVPWQEIWWVGIGSIWHVDFAGVPESENPDAPPDARTAEFYPRGGETLTIAATRPEASEGATLAFDAVRLAVEHGSRSRTATLELAYRSTRGAQHVITLPPNAEVTAVFIDQQLEPLRAEAGILTVPILPGEHKIRIEWREVGDIGVRTETPAVDIGAASSNITLASDLPLNRWLLGTSGPKLGPAVLYWSELAVLIVFALILGRVELTPLRARHWLLLGLGFSTFSWPVLGMIVAWLLITGARATWTGVTAWWRFNLLQVMVAGATIVALIAIVSSLPIGLLGTPDMHVTGNGSYGNSLKWFADSSQSVLPTASAWTLPLWVYKTLILGWALWLSFALIRWLPWVWRCFSSEGYWRARTRAE